MILKLGSYLQFTQKLFNYKLDILDKFSKIDRAQTFCGKSNNILKMMHKKNRFL